MKQKPEHARAHKIVECLSTLHIMVRTQIETLFGDDVITCEALAWAKNSRYVGEKIVDIPAAGGTVCVMYLKAKGREYIKNARPELARFVRTGMPKGRLANRIYHDLLVVEVLVWFWRRSKIVEFYTEDQLKSAGDTPADLQVITLDQNDNLITSNCEIAVRNTRMQIAAKAAGLIYFTPSQTKADMIERERNTPVITIKLKTNCTQKAPKNDLTSAFATNIYKFLASRNLALTSSAVAIFFNKRREKTSMLLKNLVDRGLLNTAAVHIEPGTQIGCPEKLYAPVSLDLTQYPERIFYLLFSQLMEKAIPLAVKLLVIEKNLNTVVLACSHQLLMIYIDNVGNTLDQEIVKYKEVSSEFLRKNSGRVYFIPGNPDRFLQLIDRHERVSYIDLVFQKGLNLPFAEKSRAIAVNQP